MALRNKAFGSALEFVWAVDSSEYAVRESVTSVKIFKNFKEKKQFKPEFGAEGKVTSVLHNDCCPKTLCHQESSAALCSESALRTACHSTIGTT